MATKQGFHSRVRLYNDLTISVFHFPVPVSISTVSNCPLVSVLGVMRYVILLLLW